jgi:hypothetical protein
VLELIAAIPELDPSCKRARGVLTGEASVTIGAASQGMVAGDLVNTALRIQSAAAPGTVLAGEVTKRATNAAVLYEDAGTHELKGKPEPVPLYRACASSAPYRPLRVENQVQGLRVSHNATAPLPARLGTGNAPGSARETGTAAARSPRTARGASPARHI